jgi:hypothetical protein
MRTGKNRGRCDRSSLRYPSGLTDDEWKLVESLIPPGRPACPHRLAVGAQDPSAIHVLFLRSPDDDRA